MDYRGQSSVEDILDSIKKVIARDHMVTETSSVVSPEMAQYAAFSPGAEFGEDETDYPEQSTEIAAGDHAPLLGNGALKSMRDNLDALAMMSEPGARPQIVRSGETSLEGMAREMLRPMLAEWLERNLPQMVEQMVQAEISRIAAKK